MFPGLMAIKFNLFALLLVEGDGGAEAAPAMVPGAGRDPQATTVRGQGCPQHKLELVLLPT